MKKAGPLRHLPSFTPVTFQATCQTLRP